MEQIDTESLITKECIFSIEIKRTWLRLLNILVIVIISVFYSNNISAQDWNEIIKAVPSDRGSNDNFGWAVAISGPFAIVGAQNEAEDSSGEATMEGAGSAYIFESDISGNWSQVQKLVAEDRGMTDRFGISVDISDSRAIVGAYFEDEDEAGENGLSNSGSAYIFERDDDGIWSQVQKIVASDRASDDEFAHEVAISRDYAIVGAKKESEDHAGENTLSMSGSAYVFKRDSSGVWSQTQKIVSSDRDENDWFGYSVGISEPYLIVGSRYEDEDESGGNTLSDAGSAYIFEIDADGTWNQSQKIVASDRGETDWFGYSVDISGTYAIVGAELEDEDSAGENTLADAGSAYIYERTDLGEWIQVQKIVASDRDVNDRFSFSVSILGETMILGTLYEDEDGLGNNTLNDAGSAYIFERNVTSGVWSETQKLVASDREELDSFGYSVGISDTNVLIGAPLEDDDVNGENPLSNSGSIYVFDYHFTGIDEGGFYMTTKLYPNPNDGTFTLSTNGPVTIVICSLLGEILFRTQILSGGNHTMALERMPKGLYFVQVMRGAYNLTYKMVVE